MHDTDAEASSKNLKFTIEVDYAHQESRDIDDEDTQATQMRKLLHGLPNSNAACM